MSCKYCVYLGSDDDGGDYSSNSWPICEAEMPVANLKGFPFKKVPKPCRRIFSISPYQIPVFERFVMAEELLCENLCRNADLDYESKNCSRWECDAFLFIVGKTDIDLKNYPVDKIKAVLAEMKFKHPFEFAEYSPCPECNGKGFSPNKNNLTGFNTCYGCEGKGQQQINIPSVKVKQVTATCKLCGTSRKIHRGYIDKRNGKCTLFCYTCKKDHDISNYSLVSQYQKNNINEVFFYEKSKLY